MTLTLKRGSGRVFTGSNWKLASDKHWEVQLTFLPGSPRPKEIHQGDRLIDGVMHSVWLCLNDEFFAQPLSICELPIPEDEMEIVYSLAPPVEEFVEASCDETDPNPEIDGVLTMENKTVETETTELVELLRFTGKNWKLTSDKKWKSVSAGYSVKHLVGEKTINQVAYKIYKVIDGFAAIKE